MPKPKKTPPPTATASDPEPVYTCVVCVTEVVKRNGVLVHRNGLPFDRAHTNDVCGRGKW